MTSRCHAGADHGDAFYSGAYGVLCTRCWVRVVFIIARYAGGRT